MPGLVLDIVVIAKVDKDCFSTPIDVVTPIMFSSARLKTAPPSSMDPLSFVSQQVSLPILVALSSSTEAGKERLLGHNRMNWSRKVDGRFNKALEMSSRLLVFTIVRKS